MWDTPWWHHHRFSSLDALAKGEVDASLLWGPVAGYENKRKFANRWKVTPLTGADMNGQVSVAVRRDKPELGRIKFNDQCSHCHGADGASPIRERDVRRLNIRYDAKWRDLALATIKNGRSDLGMPAWKEILSEAELQQVFSFIETIQKKFDRTLLLLQTMLIALSSAYVVG